MQPKSEKYKAFLERPAYGVSDDDLELESPTSYYEVLPMAERRRLSLLRSKERAKQRETKLSRIPG